MTFNEKGFSLIEMLVTVAIIGVLMAIAVPAYQRYAARAKQSEAKMVLSYVYTAERSFAMESGSYTTCLTQIGVPTTPGANMPGGNDRIYAFGFHNTGSNATNCGPANAHFCDAYDFEIPAPGALGRCANADQFVDATLKEPPRAGAPANPAVRADLPNTTNNIGRDFFVARAAGNLGAPDCGATSMDTWAVDHNKLIRNTTPCL